MDSADTSLESYDTLHNSIPSIGFLSRRKRIIAYLKVTKLAQNMINDETISEDNALYLISVLMRKSSDFQKSATMVALNLETINHKIIPPIGFKFANNMRCNLQMLPIDDRTLDAE